MDNSNYIFISIAKGDSSITYGKRVGDVIDYVDGSEVDDPEIHFSEYHRSIYDVRKVAKNDWLDYIKSNLNVKNILDQRIDLNTIDVDIDEYKKFKSQHITEITKDPRNVFKNRFFNPPIKDTNLISTGSYTVGTAGDYATWQAAKADITNLTGNLTLTQISNVTETASNYLIFNLAGNTLTFTSTAHNGNPNAGYLTQINHANNVSFIEFNCEGPGTCNIYNLSVKKIITSSNTIIQFVTIDAACTINVYNNIFNGNGFAGVGVGIFDTTPTVNVWNNMICNFSNTNGAGFSFNGANGSNTYENCTIYNCYYGIDDNDTVNTFNNILLIGNTTNVYRNTSSTSNNCGTDKSSVGMATDNNARINLILVDELESTSISANNFLKVKGAITGKTGITPTNTANNTGIRGNSRPGSDNKVSIGADEYYTPEMLILMHN